jgi:hypothetical protein
MDYDNIECWQVQEAFNKAQLEWVRRMLHANTPKRETPEQNISMIDNLQTLLTEQEFVAMKKKPLYYETELMSDDYLAFVRVSAVAQKDCCKDRRMTVYLGEEANAQAIMGDNFRAPNFEWAETFCTVIGDKVRIYTAGDFELSEAKLTYYRMPVEVEFAYCANIDTGGTHFKDVECELKDDIVETIIDEAVAILAGDIADFNNSQRSLQNSVRNS